MVGKIDNMIEEKVQKTQDEFLSAGVQNKGNTKSRGKRKGLEVEEVKQSTNITRERGRFAVDLLFFNIPSKHQKRKGPVDLCSY
jgi:hypothetical protein